MPESRVKHWNDLATSSKREFGQRHRILFNLGLVSGAFRSSTICPLRLESKNRTRELVSADWTGLPISHVGGGLFLLFSIFDFAREIHQWTRDKNLPKTVPICSPTMVDDKNRGSTIPEDRDKTQ